MRSTAYRAALLTAIAARATQTAAAAQDFGWMTAEMRSEGSAGERPSRLRSFFVDDIYFETRWITVDVLRRMLRCCACRCRHAGRRGGPIRGLQRRDCQGGLQEQRDAGLSRVSE